MPETSQEHPWNSSGTSQERPRNIPGAPQQCTKNITRHSRRTTHCSSHYAQPSTWLRPASWGGMPFAFVIHNLPGMFQRRARNIPGVSVEQLRNIPGKSQECPRIIPETSQERPRNVPGTSKEHPSNEANISQEILEGPHIVQATMLSIQLGHAQFRGGHALCSRDS